MVDVAASAPVPHNAELQRQRAALHTSGDAWRTAAVMTCFLSPFGLLFGVTGLIFLRGLGGAIEQGREEVAQRKLAVARKVVLVGAAVALLTLLVSVIFAAQALLTLLGQLEQLRDAHVEEP